MEKDAHTPTVNLSTQNLYILMLMLSNVLLSIVGTIRGIGIMHSDIWDIEDGKSTSNNFCKIYNLLAPFVW